MGRKRKVRATPPPADQPVVWRGGVHLVGTPIWCDARRARDLCFVSRADWVPASQHGQLIATGQTLALLAGRQRSAATSSELAVPVGHPFSLGTLRLELFPSGSAIGAASIAVDTGERRAVYAGAVNPRGGGLGGAAEQRACEILVVSARYGDPLYAFPPVDEVIGRAIALAGTVFASGGVLVLLVSGPLDGLDVAHRLEATGALEQGALVAQRSIHHAAQRLRNAGLAAPAVRRFGRRARPGQVLLWPAARRAALGQVNLPPRSAIALTSGDAVDPLAIARARADHGLPWSSEADFAALHRYIDETGASAVYLIGRFGESMAMQLSREGRTARPLGPPVQMSLFA